VTEVIDFPVLHADHTTSILETQITLSQNFQYFWKQKGWAIKIQLFEFSAYCWVYCMINRIKGESYFSISEKTAYLQHQFF